MGRYGFMLLYGWRGERWRWRQVNSSSFGGFKGEYLFYIRREVRANFLNGWLEIFSILTGEGRKGWGVGKSVLYRIAPLFLEYKQAHLYYLKHTRREVYFRLFNCKLLISSILAQGWRKDDMQVSQFLFKSLNYFWDESSSTWNKYLVIYERPKAPFYNRKRWYFSSLGVGNILTKVK